MAVLIACPICHKKQSERNKKCSCGEPLAEAKRAGKLKCYVRLRDPGTQRMRLEYTGTSIEGARDRDRERKQEKRRGLAIQGEHLNAMWKELAAWYMSLPSVKRLRDPDRVDRAIQPFLALYGDRKVREFTLGAWEEYVDHRFSEGYSRGTLEYERTYVGAMIRRADDHERIDPRVVRLFRRTRRLFRPGSNARTRVLSVEEYIRLTEHALPHLRAILVTAYSTGIRPEELYRITWSMVDMKKLFFRLPPTITKEQKDRRVPINHYVRDVLTAMPRGLHGEAHVFTYKRKPITRTQKSLATACRKAGIVYGDEVPGGFVFRDIRTSVKTNMLRAGVDQGYRDMILGHAMQGMDSYYLQPTEEDLHQAMSRYTRWLDAQIEQVTRQVMHQVMHHNDSFGVNGSS
jgi:integrase